MDNAGKQVPSGNYTFKATVLSKGNTSTTPVSIYATVNSVSQGTDKSIMLNVAGGKSVKLTDLKQIGI
jgi:flagellar hook assembly protein FlgD